MTIREAGVEAPKIKVAGVDALRVMVGTGTGAVEAWPGFFNVALDFTFANQDQLKWAPIAGFDSRTVASSPHKPSFVYLDQLVAGDNATASYHTRLVDQQIDGDQVEFTVTMGDTMNTLTRPSYLVLASNLIFTRMLILEFGSNGTRLFSVINGTAATPYTTTTTLASGDHLQVIVHAGYVNINKNGSSIGIHYVPTLINQFKGVNGRMYPGFGMYSVNGAWSTRIQRIQITGKTSYKRVLAASEAFMRITVPDNVWTEVARSVIPTGGRANVSLIGGKWNYAASSGDRKFRLKVDGLFMGSTADEVGDLTFTNLDLFDNSVVTVEAIADTSNSSYREITGGILQIGDPSLPV